MASKTQEQRILDKISEENYMEYQDNPMFAKDAKPPKGLTSKQRQAWNKYHFMINNLPKEESGSGDSTENVTSSGVVSNAVSNTTSNVVSNNGSGTGTVTGTGSGGTGTGGSGAGTKYNTSPTKNLAESIMNSAISDYKDTVKDNAAKVLSKTEKDAQKRQFDTKKGHTGDRYINFDTLNKEKKLAERGLREAEAANPRLQTYKERLEYYEKLSDDIKKGASDGSGEIDPEEEKKKLQAVDDRVTFLKDAIYSMANPFMKDAPFSNPEDEKKWNELNDELADLSGQKAVIQDRIKRGESFQELVKPLIGFTQDFRKLLGAEIDEFGKWSVKDGSKVNRYQSEVAKGIYAKIDQILEDGKVTPEEARAIGGLNKEISKLIDEERMKDPEIMDAEDRVNSASAKYGYFLFDQIKAWAVLLVGLSQGNASMVYSAMDMFNKKIADAEAGYTADEIKAFSNNNTKDITGSADAQYDLELLRTELEKNKAFKEMSLADKTLAVEQLKLAFDAYKNYVNGGGNEDFAVWFSTQQDNGSGWVGIINKLISAGALNFDAIDSNIKKLFFPDTTKNTKNGKNIGYNLDTSGNTQKLAQNILGAVKKEAVKGQQTKKLRDVQNTVNTAVASRMGGQGASPQGVGNAAPVNTSWGRA